MIKLTDKWRINNETSSISITLQQLVTKKKKDTKKEYQDWRDEGYYNTLQAAFKGFLKVYTREASSLEDINKRIKEVKALLGETVKAFHDFEQYLQEQTNKSIDKKLDLIISKLSKPSLSIIPNKTKPIVSKVDSVDTIEEEIKEIQKLKDKNGSIN